MILELILLALTYVGYKYWRLWCRQGYWEKLGIKARPVNNLLLGNNSMTNSEVSPDSPSVSQKNGLK